MGFTICTVSFHSAPALEEKDLHQGSPVCQALGSEPVTCVVVPIILIMTCDLEVPGTPSCR